MAGIDQTVARQGKQPQLLRSFGDARTQAVATVRDAITGGLERRAGADDAAATRSKSASDRGEYSEKARCAAAEKAKPPLAPRCVGA